MQVAPGERVSERQGGRAGSVASAAETCSSDERGQDKPEWKLQAGPGRNSPSSRVHAEPAPSRKAIDADIQTPCLHLSGDLRAAGPGGKGGAPTTPLAGAR